MAQEIYQVNVRECSIYTSFSQGWGAHIKSENVFRDGIPSFLILFFPYQSLPELFSFCFFPHNRFKVLE